MFHFWAVGNNPDGQGGTPATPTGSWQLGNNDAPTFTTTAGRTGLLFGSHPGGYSNIDTVEFVNSNPNSTYWTAGRTIEAWVRIDSTTVISDFSHYNIVAMGNIGVGNALGIRRSATSGLYFLSAWNQREAISDPTYVATGSFVHICMEILGGNTRAYINGVLVLDDTYSSGAAYSSVLPNNTDAFNDLGVALGRKSDNNQGFRGIIDKVRISRGIRYGSAFTPNATFAEDSDTWFLAQLNNNYTVDGFIS